MSIALIVMGTLGLVFGLGLALASRKFAVETDPRVSQIEEILPGINCGACGSAGCAAFAAEVANGKQQITGCIPGGAKVVDMIAHIMGVAEVETEERKVAQVMCLGDYDHAAMRSRYDGLQDCRAAAGASGGPKGCTYGCVRLGSCEKVCPFGAIKLNDKGIPVVDEKLCTGCNKCVEICPRNIIELRPVSHGVHVRCRSIERGPEVKKWCSIGCIGCMRCVKACPFDAIHVVDNLARVDYDKCTNCGKCVEVCPVNVIVKQGKSIVIREGQDASLIQ
ncbi:MAG: RnfABCDGE type electron transport complex subunit B [Bacteroidales bacterium]|nr:RnfABCDGE type electron transport complex subunit B [Bacteroidales bacterium]MDD4264802.1 RnfABCDGE type electron transport complex subunit B [Bacillota bacterium]